MNNFNIKLLVLFGAWTLIQSAVTSNETDQYKVLMRLRSTYKKLKVEDIDIPLLFLRREKKYNNNNYIYYSNSYNSNNFN